MPVSDKEISGVEDYHDDDDDDDDVDIKVHREERNKAIIKVQGFCGFPFSACLGKKAKSFVLSPLKRKPKPKSKGKGKGSSFSSGSGNDVKKKGCYFCLTQSSNGKSVSPNGSNTSDPNDPNFTYDMLRVLIERNDFCCKECNTHLDSETNSED